MTTKTKPSKALAGVASSSDPVHQTMLPVDLMEPNPWNKKRPVDAEFQASIIATKGPFQPPLLRPHPTKTGRFQIVCGERRWEASKKAGISSIRVVVHALDETAARLCTWMENHHRAGMTIWQEAELLAETSKKPGFTAAAAAAAFGWSDMKVRRRMRLLELTPKWRKFLNNPHDDAVKKWTAEMMEAIACYPAAVQDVLLEDWDIENCEDMAELKRELGNRTHLLSVAPFDLQDAKLCPKAGSCLACPKRTGAAVDLFGDAKEASGKNDKCLDHDCWEGKVKAIRANVEADLKKKHGTAPVRISSTSTWDHGGVLGKDSYRIAKEGAAGARPAILEDGPKQGSVVFVQKAVKSSGGGKKVLSPAQAMEEKRAMLEGRRWGLVAQKVQQAIEEDSRDKLPELGLPTLAAVVVTFGVHMHDDSEGWDGLTVLLKNEKKTARILLDAVCDKLDAELQGIRNNHRGSDYEDLRRTATGVCNLFHFSVAELKEKANAEIPEPKSWGSSPAASPEKTSKKTKDKKTGNAPIVEPADEDDGGDDGDQD